MGWDEMFRMGRDAVKSITFNGMGEIRMGCKGWEGRECYDGMGKDAVKSIDLSMGWEGKGCCEIY